MAECMFVNVSDGKENTTRRALNEFPVLVRYNDAVSIIRKINASGDVPFSNVVGSLMPYGLNTNYRGKTAPSSDSDLVLYASDGITYIRRDEISKGYDTVDAYKVMVSKTGAEHAGEPGKDGTFRVLTSSMKVLNPGEVCTHSYFVIGPFASKEIAENVLAYLKTKFVRFLILMAMSSINVSKLVFPFVPMQDFTDSITDDELYNKYSLSDDEISLIETMIKPMDE